MAVTDKDGNALARPALGETVKTDPDPYVVLAVDIYTQRAPAVLNTKDHEGGAQPPITVLVAKAGQKVREVTLDRLYA